MRFPWQRSEPKIALTRDEISEIASHAADQAVERVRADVVEQVALIHEERRQAEQAEETEVTREALREEIKRVLVASSPSLIAPQTLPANSAYPIYQWDNPYTWSVPQSPTRRPGSLVSTETLRQLADNYDILRDCIQHLKRETLSVPIEVVAADEKDKSAATKRAIAECQDYIATSGGLGGVGKLRTEFESALIEDLSVIGVSVVYYNRTRGGDVLEAIGIDASTIRPRVDAFGWPGPGEQVFEQWVLGLLIRGFTREEMDFRGLPINSRNHTPYPASPVEWLINCINSALRADDWNRKWLTEGTTPANIMSLPETWTPANVKEFAQYWDSLLAGDSGQRQKTRFVPGASKMIMESRKDQDFQEFELWLMRRTCAAMGVQPASIGFAGEQYKVSQQDSMQSTSYFGAGVILEWRRTFYDDLFERRGYKNVKCRNVIAREEQATERATRNNILVGAPVKTINEARGDEGLRPVDGGDKLLIPNNMVPIDLAGQDTLSAGDGSDADSRKDTKTPSNAGTSGAPGGLAAAKRPAAKGDSSQAFNKNGSVKGTPARRAAFAEIERIAIERVSKRDKLLYAPDEVKQPFSRAEYTAIAKQLVGLKTPEEIRAQIAGFQKGIYLCRHAQTDANKLGNMRGWMDFPLNAQGKQDADAVGQWLIGRNIEQVRSSDLRRAKQTSKRIRKALQVTSPYEVSFWYRDWTLGLLDGRSDDDVWGLVENYVRNEPSVDIPAGEGFNTFLLRCLPRVQAIMDLVNDPAQNGNVVALVTHSSVLRAVAAWIDGGTNADCTHVDCDTFLGMNVVDSSVLWICPSAKGKWIWTLLDPLGADALAMPDGKQVG